MVLSKRRKNLSPKTSITFEKTRELLFGSKIADVNYWVDRGEIPLGTVYPYEYYNSSNGFSEIPDEDIVTMRFDKVAKGFDFTRRSPLNVLVLGGTGDGKGLMQKTAWYILQKAGFFITYIDPKSTEAGRAIVKWENSPRLPKYVEPEGIPLAHFMPYCSTANVGHIVHNFRVYSEDLRKIKEKGMWKGLGMKGSASVVSKLINGTYNGTNSNFVGRHVSTLAELKVAITELDDIEMPKISLGNALRVITDIEDFGLVAKGFPVLDQYKVWNEENKSVVISYNSMYSELMTFDIGLRIREASQYMMTKGNNYRPIMFFLDDASYYARDLQQVNFNFASEQILEIGNNYRSLGLQMWLSVQSLGIIDDNVAEGFKWKIVSPYFANPDALKKINIPNEVIEALKYNELVKDKSRYLTQWQLVTPEGDVIRFFPFTPPSNHFKNIHHVKESEDE